jgi:hypothetical protein
MSLLVKIGIGVAVVAVIGVLFVRSVVSTRSEPYTTRSEWLRGWKVVEGSPSASGDAVISLEAASGFAGDLFRQVFARSGESMSGPSMAAIPLVLKGEFDRAFSGYVTPSALADAARAAGLESMPLTPRCVGLRRISAPGVTRQLYFVLFEAPAFGTFREQIQQLRPAEGAAAAGYDPRGLSPVLIVAATDPGFSSWLPLVADPAVDCLAPLSSQ